MARLGSESVRDKLHIRGTFSVTRKFNCVTFSMQSARESSTYFWRISLYTLTHSFRSAHADVNKLENHERVGEASFAKFMKFFFYFEVVLRSPAFSVTSVAHFRFIKRNL